MATKPPKPALKPRNIKVMKVWKNQSLWVRLGICTMHISPSCGKNIFHLKCTSNFESKRENHWMSILFTGANTHKSKIPLKIRKYAFSAIAQFLGLIIQYGRPHGKNVNKHGRPHGKNVNKHSRLLEKLKTILI